MKSPIETLDAQTLQSRINQTIRALEALSARENKFLDVIRALPIPAWYKRYDASRDEYYLDHFNPAFTETTGLGLTGYQGRTDAEQWSQPAAAQFSESDNAARTTRQRVFMFERSECHRGGPDLLWFAMKQPSFESGKPGAPVVGVVGCGVTARVNNWADASEDTRALILQMAVAFGWRGRGQAMLDEIASKGNQEDA